MNKGHWQIDNLYEDTGCSKAPACLTCPLPVCRHDMSPSDVRAMTVRANDQEKLDIMRAEGLKAAEAAERFNLTERTIYRILARNKEE